MKKFGIIILASCLLILNSCMETIDVDAEKAAIINVINEETKAYMDYDYEKVISFYVQDSLNFRLTMGADDYVFLEGWSEVEAFFKNDLIESEPNAATDTHITVVKDNYNIKVYSDAAYVMCTEKWTYTMPDNVVEIDSRQVRFMEKVDGEWKIAFLSFIGTSGYEEEEELEDLGVGFNSVN